METKHINQWSRKELLSLPVRDWQMNTIYDSLIIFSTRKKHSSGWAIMCVIGCRNMQPVEIVGECSDDIGWFCMADFRTDCLLKSGAIHYWDAVFTIGSALSTLRIKVNKKREQ